MRRLIEADALKDTIHMHHYVLRDRFNFLDHGMFTIGIDYAIDEQPTIDAVEVVRCKDCKNYHLYQYNNTPRGDGYCSIARITNDGELYINVSDEHYCSYGEAKESPHCGAKMDEEVTE